MGWLKALVIGMGVLIVAGIGVVAVTLVNRMGGAPTASSSSTAGRIEMPQGAQILETHLDGGRIAVRYALPDGRMYLDVYEPNGKLVLKTELVEHK